MLVQHNSYLSKVLIVAYIVKGQTTTKHICLKTVPNQIQAQMCCSSEYKSACLVVFTR